MNHGLQCPRIAAVEYFTDGMIKRVEYHRPFVAAAAPPVFPTYNLPPFGPQPGTTFIPLQPATPAR